MIKDFLIYNEEKFTKIILILQTLLVISAVFFFLRRGEISGAIWAMISLCWCVNWFQVNTFWKETSDRFLSHLDEDIDRMKELNNLLDEVDKNKEINVPKI